MDQERREEDRKKRREREGKSHTPSPSIPSHGMETLSLPLGYSILNCSSTIHQLLRRKLRFLYIVFSTFL